MWGNVWEWVWDYSLPYPNSKFNSPAFEKKHYILRGMSFMGVGHFNKKDFKKVVALKSRASFREHLNPLAIKKDVGFRCAKDRPPLIERLFGPKTDSPKQQTAKTL